MAVGRSSSREESAAAFVAARSAGAAFDVWLSSWQAPTAIIRKSENRLRTLIEFARAHSPLYQRLYRDFPADVVPSLAELPVLTKRKLMSDLAASLTVRDLPRTEIDAFLSGGPVGGLLRDQYAVWTSSGTTGTPGIYLHDRNALAIYDGLEMFRFRGPAAPVEMAARFMAGERFAMVAATGGHFAGAAMIERLRRSYPWLASNMRVLSLLQPLAELVQELNAFKPSLVATYPTAADLLASEKAAGRLTIAPREIWTGGECLCAATRTHLAQAFGARVRNSYGSSEFLSIAAECSHGALHVNSDWVILEPVDASYRVVDPGETSATVLITNLANGIQPLLRYDLGDSVTVLPEPCPCGNPLPAVRVEGRHDDTVALEAPDGRSVTLLPLVLETVLEETAHVHDFQLIQRGSDRLVLRLGRGAEGAGPRACAVLTDYLRTNGLANTRLEVAAEPPQREAASGKLRRVICDQHPH
jgi:phenylacetate-coenzyme A ligase PaaK-like adenylate-forming protein